MEKRIGIVGSINVDLVTQTSVIASEGETVMGENFDILYGGKGANEAVSIARLENKCILFGCLGDDLFSDNALNNLNNEGVETKYIERVKGEKCGFANIIVNNKNNRIFVISGANKCVDINYINKVREEILKCDMVGGQFEVPIESLLLVSRLCKENNIPFVLNPSPVKEYPRELFDNASYVIVNEVEISKIEDEKDENKLLEKYSNKLILTKGSKGCFYHNGKEIINIKSLKVNVIDTTGAGDTFMGSFMYGMVNGMELYNALVFANICAGLKTTKLGAQVGMPRFNEVKEYIENNKIEVGNK